jgi:hypothetical protein
MRERDAIAIDLEDSRLESIGEAAVSVRSGSELDEVDRRLDQCGDHTDDVRSGRTEDVEALEHEVLERGRDRQLLARLDAAAPLDCARELEGEKGIPTRGLADAQEDWARKRGSGADPEELVESA